MVETHKAQEHLEEVREAGRAAESDHTQTICLAGRSHFDGPI